NDPPPARRFAARHGACVRVRLHRGERRFRRGARRPARDRGCASRRQTSAATRLQWLVVELDGGGIARRSFERNPDWTIPARSGNREFRLVRGMTSSVLTRRLTGTPAAL